MYPDDLFFLSKKIYLRKAEERIINMSDSVYPMADEDGREMLMTKLKAQRDELKGLDPLGRHEKLDREGFARLKAQLAQHSKAIVVK